MSLFYGYEDKIDIKDLISKLYMINYLNLHLHSPLAKTLIWEYFTRNAECMY